MTKHRNDEWNDQILEESKVKNFLFDSRDEISQKCQELGMKDISLIPPYNYQMTGSVNLLFDHQGQYDTRKVKALKNELEDRLNEGASEEAKIAIEFKNRKQIDRDIQSNHADKISAPDALLAAIPLSEINKSDSILQQFENKLQGKRQREEQHSVVENWSTKFSRRSTSPIAAVGGRNFSPEADDSAVTKLLEEVQDKIKVLPQESQKQFLKMAGRNCGLKVMVEIDPSLVQKR